jgi:hypothetical protein
MLPPVTASGTAITTVNGRTYTCAPGSYLDVPDFDGNMLAANGWIVSTPLGTSTTANRPTAPLVAGMRYLDTTLGYTIVWDGATWRNPTSGASV